MRRLLPVLLLTLALGLPGSARAARDQLVIGITQFPSTFNPNIDAMAAKSYILGMAQRPFTAYDAGWQLVCMLCTELPTLENGKAVIEKRRRRQRRHRAHLHDPARRHLGRRHAGHRPTTCCSPTRSAGIRRAASATPSSTGGSPRSTGSTPRPSSCTSTGSPSTTTASTTSACCRRISSGRCSRPIRPTYRTRTTYDTETTNPGLYFGPYRIAEVSSRAATIVLEPNPTWWGDQPHFRSASSSRSSRTRPRSRPTCSPATST